MTTIGFLLLNNLYTLFSGQFIALIPIVFQSSMLLAFAYQSKDQRKLIRIWSSLLIVAGGFGLISSCAGAVVDALSDLESDSMGPQLQKVLFNVAMLTAGIYYLSMLNKSTTVLRDAVPSGEGDTHAS